MSASEHLLPYRDPWDIDNTPDHSHSQSATEWYFFRLASHLGFDAEWGQRYDLGARYIKPDLVVWDDRDEPLFLIECKPWNRAGSGIRQMLDYCEAVEPHRAIITAPRLKPTDKPAAWRYGIEVMTYADLKQTLLGAAS